MIPALLLFAALAQTADGTDAPAVPPTPTAESPAAPAAPSPVADADMREFAAITGRKVVGRPAGGPYGTADKLLLLARDDKGYPVVGGSTGFPTRQSLPAPPPGTLAIIRLRQKAEMIVSGETEPVIPGRSCRSPPDASMKATCHHP